MADVRQLRGLYADRFVEYRNSPHLAQWPLQVRLVSLVHDTIKAVADAGLPLAALEVGAGHGGYTGPLLAAGCAVTAVELSLPALQRLEAKYSTNGRLTGIFDPEGGLADAGDGYSLVVCVSVLHHIPDYLSFLGRIIDRVAPGGAILMLQDPLWYPRMSRPARTVDRAAYLAWRLGQGNVRDGVAAMRRRLQGAHPETKAGEITYYHVTRQGVDERAVAALLQERFTSVEVRSYWSNHLSAMRRPAELAGFANTFALRSTGHTG